MYESWYGFREKPFNLTPDPKYLYLSRRHAEAFAHLEFGRRERGGFILITGEVGTGKTTLARYFLSKFGPDTHTAFVLYPALTADELLRTVLDDLHVKPEGASKKSLVDALHRFLLESRAANRNVVLLIDEAQDLSAEVLEQIRLISNLETDTEKLIQIVLIGQSELRDLLARHELRQLAQRVTARYHLSPLSLPETGEYVRHRVVVAGGEGKVGFTAEALASVHRFSGGVPRLVNLVCDRALLAGYVKGSRTITAEMVRQAAEEVAGDRPAPAFRWHHGLIATGLTLALAVLAFAVAPRLAQAPEAPPPGSAPWGCRHPCRPRRRLPRPRTATGWTRSSGRRRGERPSRRRRRGSRPRGAEAPSRARRCARTSSSCALSTSRPCSRCSTRPAATPASSPSSASTSARRSWRPATPRRSRRRSPRSTRFWTQGRGPLVARAGRDADRPRPARGLGATGALGPRLRRAGHGRGGEPLPAVGRARSGRPSRPAHPDGPFRVVAGLEDAPLRERRPAVSLILDALKKLEHEKNAREPGVLVVGSVPWGERRRSRRPLALAAAALVALAFAGWWWLRPTPRPTAAAPVPVSPAPTPSPVVAAHPDGSEAVGGALAPSSAAPAPPARRPAVPTLDETAGPPAPPEGAAAASGPARPRTTSASTRSPGATAGPWRSSTTGSCSKATASTASGSCASARPRSRSRCTASAACYGSRHDHVTAGSHG